MAQQKWRRYETLVILDPALGTEGTEQHIEKMRGFVTAENGRILKSERWGVKDMAFELKGRSKAYYYLLEYAGLPRVSLEMARRLNLIDTVVKFQTILLQENVDPESLTEPEVVVAEPAAKAASRPAPAPTLGDDSDDSDDSDAGED